MAERPIKLPFAATHVVSASRVLSWGVKSVWLATHALDQGPEGAWISNESLAARLGLSPRTVKNYRAALSQIVPSEHRLLITVPRPGARQVGWVATLPRACVPHANRIAGEAAVALAAVLDGLLRESGWTQNVDLSGLIGGAAQDPPDGPQRTHGRDRAAAALGGKGGVPASASSSEAQLRPAVKQFGEGAHAPKAEAGGPESFGSILRRIAGS